MGCGCGTQNYGSATGYVTPNGIKPASATLLTQNSTTVDIKATNASPAAQSNWAVDLLGATLCSKRGQVETRDALANKKLVCLYFSAHWCPPCRGFTPVLEEKYKELKGIAPDDMEVVFVSSDRDSRSFNEYYATMSWLALPFADRDAKQRISEKFGVSGIPMLVVLDGATGAIKAANGRSAMQSGKVEEVVKLWCDVPSVVQPMSEKPDGATQNSTAVNTKVTNASTVTQSNWAVDLLGATLCSKRGQVETRDALANKKLVCLYFSAHWCPPCRGFTPVLEEKYKELKGIAPDDMEVVFISSDRDSTSFNEYYATMSWLALPFADRDAKQRVSEKFGVNGIPMLVVLDGDTGAIKVANGRSAMQSGKVEEVVKLWCDAQVVAQSTSEKKPAPPSPYRGDAASDYLWAPASGIPKTLTITKTGKPNQEYVEEYVGVWRHEPLATNPHVFTHTSSGQTLYWQDNRMHWRTGDRKYADPSIGNFGCGQAYLSVPSGPSERYSQYQSVVNGSPCLTFSWA